MDLIQKFTSLFLEVWTKGILGIDIFQIIIGIGIFLLFLLFRGLISRLIIKRLEKIVKKLGNVGPTLVYTGALKGKSPTNPFSDNTPKTDILGDKKHRISLKKKGGSQLGSGTGPEAKGMFVAGKAFYEENPEYSGGFQTKTANPKDTEDK